MASLLAPSSSQPARISQVLPTVKCSNCNLPVPLDELGDHICPPQTASPSLGRPHPARVASPAQPTQRYGTPPIRHPPPHERVASPFNDRLPAHTAFNGLSVNPRSSPLARNDTATPLRQPQDFRPPTATSLRPPAFETSQPNDNRTRAVSNASFQHHMPLANPHPIAQSPLTPPLGPPPFIPMREPVVSFSPAAEKDIDTKSGGVAGMAGVGRRGFAAVARAAMFVAPLGHPMDRRSNLPRFLDMNVPVRTPDTPPLSAGSGYSSHSPDPHSPNPQTDFVPEALLRLPLPALPLRQSSSNFANIQKSPTEEFANGFGLSPLDRIPFLGKYRNQASLSTSPESLFSFEQTKSPPHQLSQNLNEDTTQSTHHNDGPLLRENTNTALNRETEQSLPPVSDSDSDSECGLAYADSTDDEDDATQASSSRVLKSVIRSDSTATKINRVHFSPSRQSAASLYSSTSGPEKNDTIAKVLRSPPTSPSRLGKVGKVESMSLFGSGRPRSDSDSSNDSRSTYSRATSIAPLMMGPLSKGSVAHTMETLLEGVALDTSKEDAAKESAPLSKQRSPGDDTHVGNKDRDRSSGHAGFNNSGQPHRSNTVQVLHSPENRPPKLPTRSKTTNGSKSQPHNGKMPRMRVCLRCQKTIIDGRWIRVDTGGALCEACWKNMYLPKCRRCMLPIEKQAVSSADGQLKGKYHKECFNCHVCHKPFPDKSFYVFDGQPLCAYHYHEANRSLCAATRCGQPVEGPCALSHTGDRYHPEHMTCEYPSPVPCEERLKEYWEVDGKMMCESHAAQASREQDDEEEWVQTSTAKKRITRFMNLSSTGEDGEDGGDLSDSL